MAVTSHPRRWPFSLLGWGATLAVCGAHFVNAYAGRGPGRFPDLHVYRGAVESLLHGQGLYDFAAPNGDPFTYPPFAAVVLIPIAWVPEVVMEISWFLLEVGALIWLALIVSRVRFPGSSSRAAPWLALGLAISAPAGSNIEFGQISVFVLCMLAATVLGRSGGVPLGLSASVKLLPAAAIPFLFVQRRPRAALVALATFLVASSALWVLLPTESARFWLKELPSGTAYGDTSLVGNQSLLAVLQRAGLPDGAGRAVWLVASAALAVWAIARARRMHPDRRIETLVVIAAVVVVASPVSWTHHQLLLVLAALWPVSHRRWRQVAWSSVVLAIMTVNLWNVQAPGPLGWVLTNGRFLLALTVAVALPIPREIRGREIDPRARRRVGFAAAVGAIMFTTAGCSPAADGQSAHIPVTVLSHGSSAGKQWSFGHRLVNGQQCLVVTVERVEQQLGCDVPADDKIPINFGVVNDDGLILVAGSVSDKAVRVRLITGGGQHVDVKPARVDPLKPRIFCVVTTTDDRPTQLVVLDAANRTLGSGGDKFATAVATPPAP